MLLSTPQGFASAARTLCGFPQDLLAELANEVLDFLSYKIGAVDNVTLEKRLLNGGIVLSEVQVQGCVNALIFTLRDAIQNGIDAATLSKELKNFGASVFTGKSVNVLKHVWASRGAQACTDAKALPQSVMHVGHLVDFKWKLCLSIESSNAKNLGRAFVATEISVADNADRVKTHSFEMSLYQFQNFANQLRESNTLVQEI
eukprot:m.260233 g.260233  ORF g.260233 m.260233 type:complete len:202 (-) comp39512_c0_seq1:241-846(-)